MVVRRFCLAAACALDTTLLCPTHPTHHHTTTLAPLLGRSAFTIHHDSTPQPRNWVSSSLLQSRSINADLLTRNTLPPIHSLFPQFHPCRNPGCQQQFADAGKALQHEQTCDTPMQNTLPFGSFQDRKFIGQVYPIQTTFDTSRSPSVVSESAESSSGSSPVFSPSVTCADSLGAPTSRRPSSELVFRTVKSNSRKGNPKTSVKKSCKEKKSRENQIKVQRDQEAMLRNYTGWQSRKQSSGNSNVAGLEASKISVMRGTGGLSCRLIDEAYRRALLEGRLPKWQAWARGVIEEAIADDPDDQQLFRHTLMLKTHDVPCSNSEQKSKPCVVHGHSNWVECRRQHVDANFQKNRDAFCRRVQAASVQHKSGTRRLWSRVREGIAHGLNSGLF